MRIVIGCDTRNKYVGQLARSLSQHRNVDAAEDRLMAFWRPPDDTDIVHIQWPEALFNWKKPKPWELAWLEDRLDRWASTSAIVTTVHNYEPHSIAGGEELYHMVYERSDGIVHLGEASRRFFFDRYPFAADLHHAVIPHGNYTCFPNDVSPSEARTQLGLGRDDAVYLCFGNVRHPEERDLLLDAFDALKVPKRKLVIAGRLPPLSRRTLKYWRIRYDPRIVVEEGWIPDEDVQLYLNAADVVVIPREGTLNSGNVALGFTFGCVVVGPDEGVIGEMLRAAGNPVHKPGNPKDLAHALEEAMYTKAQVGEQNKRYAIENMSWEVVAQSHIKFYTRSINS